MQGSALIVVVLIALATPAPAAGEAAQLVAQIVPGIGAATAGAFAAAGYRMAHVAAGHGGEEQRDPTSHKQAKRKAGGEYGQFVRIGLD